MKYQLTSRKPTTAAASAGQTPPTAEITTTSSRKSSSTLGSPRSVAEVRRAPTSAAAGRPRASSEAEQHAPPRERARPARRATSSRRAPSSARLITCTSRPTPESRITRLITEPRVSSAKRERRVAPRTICVALSVWAVATSASPMSAPTTSRYVPPSSSTSSRCAVEPVGGAAGEAVLRPHVDGEEVALRPRRHARCAPHEALAVGGARQRDDDALARLPGPVDAVALAVVEQRVVDAVGDPEQRELAQRAEVAGAEVVPERRVDPLGRVDVPVRHPAPDRLGRHVDELDLVGPPHDGVGDRLLLLDAGDLLDDVVDRLEVLDVERRDHGDARRRAAPRRPPSASRAASPGTFVWASSSTRATSGRRAMIASTSISSNVVPRYSTLRCAAPPRGRRPARRSSGGRASRRSRRRRPCRARRGGDPRRASRTSCRPRARRRGRCEAFPVPCAEE